MESTQYNRNGKYVLVVCPNPSVDIFVWLDNFKTGGVNRAIGEKQYPGGKGVHVALAIAELGLPVKLLGFWGGPTGNWIKAECEKRYDNLQCIGLGVHGWARSCHTLKSTSKIDDTEILGMGPELTPEEVEIFYKSFEDYLPEAMCVTMSGSWPQGSPDDAYANLIGRAKSENKAVILDCSGVQLEKALQLNPYAVHLNKKEAKALTGISNVAFSSAQLGEQTVAAITDGANGLYLSADKKTIHASCKINKVYSAVGSGDCLTAGIAVAFCNDDSLRDAAKLGVACGAANCLREDLGMLHKSDVDDLLKNIQIHSDNVVNVGA